MYFGMLASYWRGSLEYSIFGGIMLLGTLLAALAGFLVLCRSRRAAVSLLRVSGACAMIMLGYCIYDLIRIPPRSPTLIYFFPVLGTLAAVFWIFWFAWLLRRQENSQD